MLTPNDIGVLANFLTPRKYEQIALAGLESLTPPVIHAATGAIIALIQSEGGTTRWRDDGTNPTGTVGFKLTENTPLQYNIKDLSKIKFIADTTTPATQVNVSYYTYSTEAEAP